MDELKGIFILFLYFNNIFLIYGLSFFAKLYTDLVGPPIFNIPFTLINFYKIFATLS